MTTRCTLVSTVILAAATSVSPPHLEISRSLDTAEFIALHRLSDRALRMQFSLPSSCDPSLSAVRDVRGRFQVTITCSPRLATDEPPPWAIDEGRRR